MSNLSLSFSFYFWWINSSQSVTLTNSLSQTVNVMPTSIRWFGYHNPSTGNFVNYYPSYSYTLTERLNDTYVVPGTGDTAIFGVANPISLTDATKVKFMFSGTIKGGNNRYVFLNICNATDVTNRAKEIGLYNSTAADITYTNEIVEIDVSDLTGNYYPCVQWAPNISGQTREPLTLHAFWIE